MKCFKTLSVLAFCLVSLAVISNTAQFGSSANKPCPIVCVTGGQAAVTAAATQATVGTALSVNYSRADGWVQNTSTFTLKCSLTDATTTAIDAAYFTILPTPDSYGRDRFMLKHNDNVYQGPLYFYGYDAAIGTGVDAKRAGTVQSVEWK